ncbi:MAG: WD40 repeat domain-containing protein [Sphingomonadales bacterium]|nr:MAG: WD40 repeat domain-containing protein [Sphingomonadales bacterium]
MIERDAASHVLAMLPWRGALAAVLADGRWLTPGDEGRATTGECLAAAGNGTDVVVADDSGAVTLLGRDEPAMVLAGQWVDQVAISPDGKWIAAAAGKRVHVAPASGGAARILEHDSSATGLVFDARSKRLAVSHYNGASLWWLNAADSKPTPLSWVGSHTAITWSPDGRFIVTAMQENALHGWRLEDKADMRMSGYPAKTKSFAWTDRGRCLATSGAHSVILWPFADRNGPMGKAPRELAGPGALVSQIAAHGRYDLLAAGYADGSMLLYRLGTSESLMVWDNADAPVSAAAFFGNTLGCGTQDGRLLWLDLPF